MQPGRWSSPGSTRDPTKAGELAAWAKGYWEAMRPYTLGGAYVNFLMDEGVERIKATYREKLRSTDGN